jgi:murein DD-endopeptidase MepM/ murein hydrolase activator NlpD
VNETRGQTSLLLGRLVREKRLTLGALALLLLSIGALLLYRRFESALDQPTPPAVQQPAPDQTVQGAPIPEPVVAPSTLAYPLDGDLTLASGYHAIDDAYGDLRYTDGISWHAAPGQGVRAAAPGKVIRIQPSPGEGMQIWIDHGGGMVTRYAGLGATLVAEGAKVTAHQVVGEVGPPTLIREAMGPHLSFSVELNGQSVEPTVYLRK